MSKKFLELFFVAFLCSLLFYGTEKNVIEKSRAKEVFSHLAGAFTMFMCVRCLQQMKAKRNSTLINCTLCWEAIFLGAITYFMSS